MADALPYGGRLMFAQSWEDPECDRIALAIQPGDHVLAILSGGDNVLALLLDDPSRLIAIDINPAQAYLFELKRAAFRCLDHESLLDLVGVTGTEKAVALYQRLSGELSEQARTYFDTRPHWFASGLLTQGGFERYFTLLRRIIRLAVGRRTVERLFRMDAKDQAEFFARNWDGWRWRALMRVGCSKAVLGNRLDPTWFNDSALADFGSHFTALAEHALVNLPVKENHFLAQILLGRYFQNCVPAYLHRENFETIRERVERVEVVVASVEVALRSLPDSTMDALALSNVFEYSPVAVFEQGKAEIARVARSGARLSHRNLLAPRRLAEDNRFVVDECLSELLRVRDRGFIYSRFEAARLAA